jgi:Tfp pilus assembly protein PilF
VSADNLPETFSMNRPANRVMTPEAQIRELLGQAERMTALGNRAEAIRILRGMLSIQATGEFWGAVAQHLFALGDLQGAEQAARKFMADSADTAHARLMLAMILGEAGKSHEALPLATNAVKKLPDNAAAQYGLGLLLARDSQFDAARSAFQRALKIDPGHADALEYLGNLGGGDEDLAAIDQALDSSAHEGQVGEAAILYGKAKILERRQDFEHAIAAYDHGATIMRSLRAPNLDAMQAYVERLKASFTPDYFERHRRHAYPNKLPIFIVGVPRSGTTLVETSLAAHPQVSSAGESTILRLATLSFKSFEPKDLDKIDALIADGANPWSEMGVALKKGYADRVGRGRRVTEKNLGHHFLLGAVSLIASGAPIIYCRRDAAATAWSCYKTRFTSGNEWSYDFDSILRYQALYADLMQHWQSVLPEGTILEVDYEDLVSRPGDVIPAIVEHAKLKFHRGCLSPEKAKTSVRTASMTEVRKPIHTDAVSGWRRYEPWLAERHEVFRTAGA